jgi:hypothetical protein
MPSLKVPVAMNRKVGPEAREVSFAKFCIGMPFPHNIKNTFEWEQQYRLAAGPEPRGVPWIDFPPDVDNSMIANLENYTEGIQIRDAQVICLVTLGLNRYRGRRSLKRSRPLRPQGKWWKVQQKSIMGRYALIMTLSMLHLFHNACQTLNKFAEAISLDDDDLPGDA